MSNGAQSLSWLDKFFGSDGSGAELANAATGALNDVVTTIDGGADASGIRFSGVAPTVSGLAATATAARRLAVLAAGGPVVLLNESGLSAAANRITTGTGASVTIANGASALLTYDTTSARWRLLAGGGGGGAGSNLGAALAVFKDVAGGTLRHRTIRVGGNKSGEADPAGFDGEVHLRPSPIGHYNPHDFGAVGDGVTDDHAAFVAMFVAMNTDALVFGSARAGTVLLADNKTYYFADNLIIERGMSIAGIGGASVNAAMSAQMKFAPGKCIWLKGVSGYDRGSANGANLRRIGMTFQPVPGVGHYQHSHAYAAGDLIYLPNDHQFIYECLVPGVSAAAPFPAWQPGHVYAPGDLVTPTTPNAHVYRCTVGGTSDVTEPVNWHFDPNSITTDGGVTWTEDYGTNGDYMLSWADIALRPGVDIHDPSTIWVAGATYEYNQIVRVPGVTASFFWLGPQSGSPVSGVAGVTPPTAGANGTTVSDGLLEWTRYDGVGFCQTDGTAIFMPRMHCGVFVTCQCLLEDIQIGGTTNYGVNVHANGGGRPAYNADFWQMVRVTGLSNLHGFIRVRGQDGQAGMAIGCTAFGNFDDVVFHEWDRGFVDLSQAGNQWIGCNSQGHSGYSFQSGDSGTPTFVGCYSESNTPSYLISGNVIGGNLSNLSLTDNSNAVMIRSGATFGLQCSDKANIATTGAVDVYLAGQKNAAMKGRTSIAVRAGTEPQPQGLTWSNTLFGWPNGWHVWAYAPGVYGGGYVTFGVTGETAPALRDSAATGQMLLTAQSGFHVNGIPGDALGSANFVCWRAALPTAGKWLVGDIIYNTAPTAGGFVGWSCVTAGDFAGTPPVFKTFGAISP